MIARYLLFFLILSSLFATDAAAQATLKGSESAVSTRPSIGMLRPLPPQQRYQPLKSIGGETTMISTGHVTPPPPPGPGPNGIPMDLSLDAFFREAHTEDPSSIVLLLNLTANRRVPTTLRFQIVTKDGRILFQTAPVAGLRARGTDPVAITLDARASAAAQPAMKAGNLFRVVTGSQVKKPISFTIGVRKTP